MQATRFSLQFLDVGFSGPLKEVCTQEADRWLVNHPGSANTKTNVARIFRSAYERVANMEMAVRAFETMGIHPFKRNVFSDEDCAPSEVSPAMVPPLMKAVHTNKWKRTSKKSEVLSSSPYKNALLPTRKEPSNNKQGRKTLHYNSPSVASTCSDSCRRREINCSGCDKAYEEPITEDWVQCSGCKQWWHDDVQVKKAWDSANVTYANMHS
jgi:hypothetical protein